MQKLLSANLTELSTRYVKHTGLSLATLSERAAGDWRFFAQVADGALNFRVRSYDRAIRWFAANWPADLEWPYHIHRPSLASSQAEQPTALPSAGTPSADAPPPASAEPPLKDAAE